MQPSQLTASHFRSYSPEAREVAVAEIGLLQKLPLTFLPLLLREVIAFDSKFPVERTELNHQFAYLRGLAPADLNRAMSPFQELKLSPELERVDWVNSPADFSEQLTAHLWATHQIDKFRTAAVAYVEHLDASRKNEPSALPRLAVVIVGQGVGASSYPLFRKLRPHGTYFSRVNPEKGKEAIFHTLAARAASHPSPFAHWYVDGGTPEQHSCPGVACLSYAGLDKTRAALLASMESIMKSGVGPEAMRSRLARMRPSDMGTESSGNAGILDQFGISVLTEGSGTQVFSTTFVQWTAREVLRRAQPLTLVARYAPRVQEQTMHEALAGSRPKATLDPEGSLRDADMGAYYTWINQRRLTGSENARFVAWFEDRAEAIVIGPSLKRGAEDKSAVTIAQLMERLDV